MKKKMYSQSEGKLISRLGKLIYEMIKYTNRSTEKGKVSSLKKINSMKSVISDTEPLGDWKPTGTLKSMRNEALKTSKIIGINLL